MTILLCGGGTGGHITPILAIAHEIKRQNPDANIIYIGERYGKFGHLAKNANSIDEVKSIYGGKLRRYHNQSILKHVLDVKTNLLNIRDLFYVGIGFLQGVSIIRKYNPDVIFIKGGYVGLPMGFAAAFNKVPFVTHDSDATQSLTTKIIGKWATYNATGMPERLYSYPKNKTRYVGVPVAPEYKFITEKLMNSYRSDLNIPKNAKLLTITGGSLGASRLNIAVSKIIDSLFDSYPDLYVYHQVGKNNLSVYKGYKHPRLTVEEFNSQLYKLTGAADLVITRSGATTVAELAIQAKPTILVPNPELTGGQQTKNAKELSNNKAAYVVPEEKGVVSTEELYSKITKLLDSTEERNILSVNIRKEALQDSANQIAMLLLSLVK